MRTERATAVLGQFSSLAHLDSKGFGHTRRATVKGDKGPEVAGVCVVESHKDCIEYHNGQLAEEGNEGRLLPRLTPGLIEFIACAGTCTLSQTGLRECDTPTCRCVRFIDV